jgi:hypothetical protein
MITVSDIPYDQRAGYLGNKMFMLANALAVAKRNNTEVVLPPWEFQNTFKKNVPTSTNIHVDTIYREPFFHYAPVPPLTSADLHGYFQCEKYFADCIPLIHEMFQPNDSINAAINARYQMLFTRETVGIHVRRGDYLMLHKFHPFPGEQYFLDAMKAAPEVEQYLIVSNDIPWCKEFFKGDQFIFSESLQEHAQGNSSAAFDLFLLSRCHHQIISNSTFSWWASYLNKNPQKVVIAPKRWFGEVKIQHGFNAKDVYLPSWIVI